MKQNSRQNKARYLQNLVKDKMLTLTAKRVFPYATECKNTEQFIGLYKHFKQSKNHNHREPLLIIKMNRQQPLAVISLEHFFELLEKED